MIVDDAIQILREKVSKATIEFRHVVIPLEDDVFIGTVFYAHWKIIGGDWLFVESAVSDTILPKLNKSAIEAMAKCINYQIDKN